MNYELSNNLDIYIWDVGHGLSITVVTPSVSESVGFASYSRRKVVQIDAGTNSDYDFSPIKHMVENRKLSVIDALVLTHPDLDHISDLANLTELVGQNKVQVKVLSRNRTIPHSAISEDPSKECEAKSVYKDLDLEYTNPLNDAERLSNNPNFFGGVNFDHTHLHYNEADKEFNNASVVFTAQFNKFQILIPGDLEGSGAEELIKKRTLPSAIDGAWRILIAPHHGRESAEPAQLLEHFKPDIVLASAKEGDEYTDPRYCNSKHILGVGVIESDGRTVNQHKFRATKGEAFHITTDGQNKPTIKRFVYKQTVMQKRMFPW